LATLHAGSSSILALLVFLGFAITLQYLAGAYHAAFSGYPDEPAHYVTGLMVHDWIASGFPWPPRAYAENYYLHYPKVALGQWPPGFYVIQAIWTLVFSTSRVSVLVLMAVLMSLLALAVFRMLKADVGWLVGLGAGLLLVALPLNQASTQNVMADVPLALLSFCAALAFGRYLDTARLRDAIAFGCLAALAILTKGNAFALALLPPIAVLFARRMHLVLHASFWAPVGVVLLLCGPWYVVTAHAVVDTFAQPLGWEYSKTAASFYAERGLRALGLALTPIVALGLVDRVVFPTFRHGIPGRWAALAALGSSVWIFHTAVSAGYEERYLLPVMPVVVVLLVAGAGRLVGALGYLTIAPTLGRALLAVTIGGVFLFGTFHIPRKNELGFVQVAADLVARPEFGHAVVLVSSEADGEGMLISEIAMRENRPGRFVLRATKALARIDWNATAQEPYYSNAPELLGYLDQVPVGVLVLDLSGARVVYEHHALLQTTVGRYPDRFQLVAKYPSGPSSPRGEIRVYRILGNENPAPGKVVIDRGRLLTR
jgi:4-amino-4-deoxy-L-arabinose transferase-like glycosyltransferase